MMTEPAGDFAVVRTYVDPCGNCVTPEPVDYVKWPSGYWRTEGLEFGWSWDQVTRYAIRIELVRDGIPQTVTT